MSGRTSMPPELRARIRAALAGDPEAFEELVNRYRGPVCAFVYTIVEDYHLAQDVCQDSFLLAHRHMGMLRDPGAFPTWLFRIANRNALTFLRERERRARLVDEVGDLRHSSQEIREGQAFFDPRTFEHTDRREEVRRAIAGLKGEWASALVLRYYEDLTCREIGRVLEIDARNVRVRLHRGRQELRRRLLERAAAQGVDSHEVRGRRTSPR